MSAYFDNYHVKQIFQLYESQYVYSGLLFNHFVLYKMRFYYINFCVCVHEHACLQAE
jgi:hypothetical protein